MNTTASPGMPQQRVFLVLGIAVLAISSAGVLVRGVGDVPALSIALWRTTLVALLLGPFAAKDPVGDFFHEDPGGKG